MLPEGKPTYAGRMVARYNSGPRYVSYPNIQSEPVHLIQIDPDLVTFFSLPGDSGACIADDYNNVINSIVAGLGDRLKRSAALANRLVHISKRFGIDICQTPDIQ